MSALFINLSYFETCVFKLNCGARANTIFAFSKAPYKTAAYAPAELPMVIIFLFFVCSCKKLSNFSVEFNFLFIPLTYHCLKTSLTKICF